MRNPYGVVREFEAAISEYTGAPFVVSTNSCTSALLLAIAWHLRGKVSTSVEIPRKTYCSVPMAIIHAGGRPTFRDEDWIGSYRLKPLPVWDCARIFTSGMWDRPGGMACVSFHASKTLGLEQGGAILHDSQEADAWFRRARFDGRTEGVTPKDDRFDMVGWHCYMNPSTAAQGILRLHSLPRHNDPLPNDDYPDLSTFEVFR